MNECCEYKGPLAGLNVVDFGHYYAGPMAAMLLADQGANVIRVLRPGEPELPSQQFRLFNRNKKLLTLNLKNKEDQLKAKSLIDCADVVIENFRPGVMKRLGLDYASIKFKNPGLVYLSLPGFASTDKERAHIQAWEGILGAASGGFTQTHLFREALGFPPLYTPVPQCSIYGAVHGVTAIMAALVAREQHGVGAVIEVPLVNAGAHAVMLTFAGLGDGAFPPPKGELAYSETDSATQQMEKLDKAMRSMGLSSKSYPCADGREIYISTYLTNNFIKRFLKALGIYNPLLQEGFVCEGPWKQGLDNDLGNVVAMSKVREARLKQLISDVLLTKTAFEWEEHLAEWGVPAMVIRTREEYLDLEPMLTSGVLTRLGEGPSTLTVPGSLCDASSPDGERISTCREAKLITYDQAEHLFRNKVVPAHQDTTPKALKKGELLQGLKVLDLCNVIAGPTSSHLLAEFGADVIKADPPDGVHPFFIPTALELNQGKRSILTDVKTAPGREIFTRLVKWADVVVHNVLDDTAKRLGVSQPQLQAINPNVVSCQLTALGGTSRGGWENRPGFDNLIQGFSGLLATYGSLQQPMWHGAVSSADTIGGISMAFASLLAVYQQRTTGFAAEARTSLIRVTNHYQLPQMIATKDRKTWNDTQGQFAVGESWYQRLYQCRDGWIYVGTKHESAHRLAHTVLGSETADDKDLENRMAERECAHWLGKLNEAGIACHRVVNAQNIRAEAQIRKVGNTATDEVEHEFHQILCWDDHPCGSPVTKLALESAVVGEERSWKRLTPAPRYGEHTSEILRELGYEKDEINEWLRLKASHDYLPGIGSKSKYFYEVEK